MTIDLYYMAASPPCRSVYLLAKALNIPLNLKHVDVRAKEHLTEDFLKINPQHTVPTIVDGDFTLWESRAILTYLASKYSKNGILYPFDPRLRVKVDFLLYFDMGTLYGRFFDFAVPVVTENKKPQMEKFLKLKEALHLLNQFLDGHFFAVGNRITVADYALVSTVSTIEACGIDISRFKNVSTWLNRCKQQMKHYEDANGKGAAMIGVLARSKLRI